MSRLLFEAFSPPEQAVSLTGIASEEAFGTAIIAGPIILTGIASEEAFGTAQLNLSIVLSGIATEEAFGTASINQVVSLVGIASEEAFGTAIVAGPITLDGIASAEAFGTAQLNLSVVLSGIATAEAFGTAALANVISLVGIASTEAFGALSLGYDQAISLTGIPTSEAVPTPLVQLFGGVFLNDAFGPTTGGKLVSITAPGVTMSNVQDDFQDGVIDLVLWTPVVTGTAYAIESAGTLRLNTSLGASSSYVLRSVDTWSDVDASVDCSARVNARTGTDASSFWLGLYASATTYARLSVEMKRWEKTIILTGVSAGYDVLSVELPAASATQMGLRLLRYNGNLHVYVNGVKIGVFPWSNEAAYVEMGVENDSNGATSLVASMSNYLRRPIIVFDDVPMETVLRFSEGRVDGYSPAHRLAGVVPVHVGTDIGSFDLNDTYEYQPAIDYKQVGTNGTDTLTVLSDTIVREAA